MTTMTHDHLTDTDTMRLLDGEATAAERARWDRHLAGCDRCAGELAAARDESRLVHQWLARAAFEDGDDAGADTPVAARRAPAGDIGRRARWPGSRRASGATPWLRAAAIVLLVAAPAAAVPSVRGWIADAVGLRGDPAVAVEGREEAAPATAPVQLVRFVPDPGEFTVRLDAPQAAGSLTVGRAEGPEASLRIQGAAEAVVSAGSLRVRNGGTSDSYRLELPAVTSRLRVLVGERLVTVEAAELDRGRTIPLAP